MSPPPSEDAGRARTLSGRSDHAPHQVMLDSLLVGVVAIGLYLALWQSVLVRDGRFMATGATRPEIGGPYWFHTTLMRRMILDLGATPSQAGHFLTALYAGGAMALCFSGCRFFGLSRKSAFLATAVCATAPAQMFHSTIVEKRTAMQFGALALV